MDPRGSCWRHTSARFGLVVTKGRRPKPTALKVLQGNPGKRPLNKGEPKPTPKAPGCPTWLSLEGKAEWRRVVPELDRIGMLTRVDRAALAVYCSEWAKYVEAQRKVQEDGLVLLKHERVATGDGGELIIYVMPTKNPAVLIARDTAIQVRALAVEFGLTPAARAKIDLPEADAADPLAGIFS